LFDYLHPETGKTRERVGIRWNGQEGATGYPKGRNGSGQWFHLPEDGLDDLVQDYAEERAAAASQ
jgi:hypothetical protein